MKPVARHTSLSALFVMAAGVAAGGPPGGTVVPGDVVAGAFSNAASDPPELQFSDAASRDPTQEGLAKTMATAEAAPAERLAAAEALWRGRSRRYAADVLKFVVGPPPGGDPFRGFQRAVDAAVLPGAVLHELQQGDYRWGTWLAFLRPHPDLVPALLAGLKDQPALSPETMLALGNCGDRRALRPLLERLASKDYHTAGDAARALGYLGDPDAEPGLITALAVDSPWRQVQACDALARMGSRRALPALERVAKDGRSTGALAVREMAGVAVERIKQRSKQP